MRASLFLDANVLFTAAHNPLGRAAFLFGEEGLDHWTLASSAYAIEEARRNLAAKYPASLPSFELLTARLRVVPQPSEPLLPLDLPARDVPIWSAALGARATHLLTGDLKHFGPHMNQPAATAGVVIQTVREFLAGF